MEIWRDAVGFSGRYQVSSEGRVRTASGLIRRPQPMNRGYLSLKMTPDTGVRSVTRTIHRLVAEAFLAPVLGADQVNHKDGNKLNNRLRNLEWVTPRDNVQHAIALGLTRADGNPAFNGPTGTQVGAQNYNARLSEIDAIRIISELNSGATGSSLARLYGVSTSLIHAIKTGRRWPHLLRLK